MGQMLIALDFNLGPVEEYAVVGDPSAEDTRRVLRAIRKRFEELFGKAPIVELDASSAVAFGAALLGAAAQKDYDTLGLKDILGSTLSVQLPDGNVAASYAGLVLEYRGTTLQDVYDARTFIEAPCAALLAQRRTEQDLTRLTEAVAQAKRLMDDPQAFIRAHMEFHALVVELAGNQTLSVLNGMVRHIIELANWSHVDLDAGSPDNVRANKRGFRAHVRLVELVTERQAAEAEALWRLHLSEAENYLLMNKSMTTVLDLLG